MQHVCPEQRESIQSVSQSVPVKGRQGGSGMDSSGRVGRHRYSQGAALVGAKSSLREERVQRRMIRAQEAHVAWHKARKSKVTCHSYCDQTDSRGRAASGQNER